MKSITLFLCLALIGGRGIPLVAQTPYKEIKVVNGGSIHGVVQLGGAAATVTKMEITKDNKICGLQKPSPRLSVGKNRGVKDAVISIEGIVEGKAFEKGGRYVLDQIKCDYVPHVMVVPAGAQVEIVNSDPILHNVHAYDLQRGSKTIFNIAQPIKGQKTPIRGERFSPGLVLTTCDAGHPWMSAYIMIADHPYYAVSDASGKFSLNNVPPGKYTLKVWHEGVHVLKTDLEHGKPKKYYFEEPYELKKEVVVPEKGNVSVDFELMLR